MAELVVVEELITEEKVSSLAIAIGQRCSLVVSE